MTYPATARLLLPRPTLGACVFAGVERDTRGVSLSDSARFNYYPATPMALISWIFEGTLHMVEKGEPGGAPTLGSPLPRLVFSGPQRQPTASWSPSSVHALSVAFYPEAMGYLLKTSIKPFVDQILPLEAVAGDALVAACGTLLAPDRDPESFRCLEKHLEPLWHGPHSSSAAPEMRDWIQSLATRAAFSKAGLGVRQMQRRIKNWLGQSHRDLQIFSRVEAAFVRAGKYPGGVPRDLAGLAHVAGFADQSHMGREVRRITGLSPARLVDLMERDEAFWFYRLIEGHLHRRQSGEASCALPD